MSAGLNSNSGHEATVFVVDDDESVRDSLEMLIRQEGWKPVLFPSARSFESHFRVNSPCCLVLDLAMPEYNGLNLQRAIAADQPFMPIIFITGFGDVPTTVEAMKAGAFEFLTKPFGTDTLVDAIQRALLQSENALRENILDESLRSRYRVLTAREREVMELIVSGRLNKQVAAVLGISEVTVKAHRGKLMRKMEADSLASLVKMSAKLNAF